MIHLTICVDAGELTPALATISVYDMPDDLSTIDQQQPLYFIDYYTNDEFITLFGGQEYLIRLAGYQDDSGNCTNDECVYDLTVDLVGPMKENDLCIDADPLDLGDFCSDNTYYTYQADCWYSFTPDASTDYLITVTSNENGFGPDVNVYSDCDSDAIVPESKSIDTTYGGESVIVSVFMEAGQEYLLSVGNTEDLTGAYDIFIEKMTYSLAVSTTGSGSVSISPVKDEYLRAEKVTLTANPSAHFILDTWSGLNASSTPVYTGNTVEFLMPGNTAVTAVFEQNEYEVTADVRGSGGTVD